MKLENDFLKFVSGLVGKCVGELIKTDQLC